MGHLIENRKLKSTTIRSYISAIKSVLQEDGLELNENKYLLSSLTRACRFSNDRVKTRLPIGKELLNLILSRLQIIFEDRNQHYLMILYMTIICTAYYGLFRIGELASGDHPVLAKDVHIGENKNKVLFVLRTSKTHWTDQKLQSVKITRTPVSAQSSMILNPHCPFQLLNEFADLRIKYKTESEPFFVYRDRTPVPANRVCSRC